MAARRAVVAGITIGVAAWAAVAVTGCRRNGPASSLGDSRSGGPGVLVVTVQRVDVPVYQEWVGTLAGSNDAVIHAQVMGYLKSQDYHDGSFVTKGQVLFELDPQSFKAAFDQASATLAKDKALAWSAQIEYARVGGLYENHNATKNEYDQAKANLDAANATTQADTAARERVRIDLSYCTIKSPVDGIAGVAQGQIGDLVGPTGPELAAVSTVDPIKATFIVSEQAYMAFRQRYPAESAEQALAHLTDIELVLADGQAYPHKGRFHAVQRQVDVQTGTVQFQAEFDNPGNMLRPGQFVRVRARTGTLSGVVRVPQRAVVEVQGAYQVMVVDDQDVAHARPVAAGQRDGQDWVIDRGLSPGERVIVEGLDKARDGQAVRTSEFRIADLGLRNERTTTAPNGKPTSGAFP